MSGAFESLTTRLRAYLASRWPHVDALDVRDVRQIPGGASRETFSIELAYREDGRDVVQRVILRRDPASSLIDTERALEYRTYAAIHPTDVPVPRPILLEEDPRHLDRPFSLMEEIPGCETAIQQFTTPHYAPLRQKIGHAKWTILGRLAALDPLALGANEFMEVPSRQTCARRELDYWAGVIAKDAMSPQPVAEATVRWLRRQMPPPAWKMSLVHGDFRSGNFLYDRQGTIRGVLDWEMAHLGDPLEDLAWSLDPLWGWPERHLAGGLLPPDEAIRIWEAASGLEVDRQAFRWWQVFASLKALAIWISSTEDFANGASKEPILAVAGWVMTDRQNRILVDRLSPSAKHRWAEPLG